MRAISTPILYLGLCSGLFLTACGQSFTPQFKPNVGDRRSIQQDDLLTMNIQMMGTNMPMTLSNSNAWMCEVTEVQDNGEVTLKLTAQQMRIDLGMDILKNLPGGGIDLSFLDKAQNALKGQSFTVKLNPAGEILAMEGVDAITRHMVAEVPLPGAAMGMQPAAMLEEYFGEPMFRKLVEAWMAPYQPISDKATQTWTRRGSDDFGMVRADYTQTYTLTGTENGLAKLSFEKTYQGGSGGSGALAGLPIQIAPKGSATGTLEMELDTGWIKSMYTEINMTVNSTMEGMPDGMSVEMQLTGNSSLQVR